MRIVIVGSGYVGLVSGACLAEVGHQVVCVDVDQAKVAKLKDAISPIFEPGLEALIKKNSAAGRLTFTTSYEEALPKAQCAFIAVGTPEGEDGSADLKYVRAVAKTIGQLASGNLCVIVKSTVPVGTCDMVEEILTEELSKRNVAFNVSVASNPEFLKEGAAIDDFMKPDRIVVGVKNDADRAVFRELYRPFTMDDDAKLMMMDRRSSELTKYGSNAMLATRISFMNELSQLCEKIGANIDNVRLGMGADPRIGKKFLYAGPGYGGSCFPKDVAALRKTGEKNGVTLSVLNAVTQANESQKRYVTEKIKRHFKGDLKGRKICLWGLAFKPGTDDVREAPALTIIEHLTEWGADVVAHDPEAMETFARELGPNPKMTYAKDAFSAIQGADALVLVTEWSEYRRPDWDKVAGLLRTKAVFDFRNQYQGEELRQRGFYYECVGRP